MSSATVSIDLFTKLPLIDSSTPADRIFDVYPYLRYRECLEACIKATFKQMGSVVHGAFFLDYFLAEPADQGPVLVTTTSLTTEQALIITANRASLFELGMNAQEPFTLSLESLTLAHLASGQRPYLQLPALESPAVVICPLRGNCEGVTYSGLLGLVIAKTNVTSLLVQNMTFHTMLSHFAQALANAQAYEQKCRQVAHFTQEEAERTSFLFNVAHELRTPSASFVFALEMLREQLAANAQPELLSLSETALFTAVSLQNMVENFLCAEAVQQGHFQISPKRMELMNMLEEVIHFITPWFAKKGQMLNVVLPDQQIYLTGDHQRLAQVFLNLLTNAGKYSPRDSVISIRVQVTGTTVELSVQDQGQGIPPEEQHKIFNRFYRIRERNSVSVSGVGLGLAIVKHIITQHQGTIRLETPLPPDHGAIFTVVLPLSSPPQHRHKEMGEIATRVKRTA